MKIFSSKIIIPIVLLCIVASGIIGYLVYTNKLTTLNIPGTTQIKTAQLTNKKVLYIDSYHEGYSWSDHESKGAIDVLNTAGVYIKRVFMDTNRHPDETYIKNKALEIKTEIDTYKPDIIISADDAALKYIIMPYYKNSTIPVVFCGINWDSSAYGTPYTNMTGMLEVSLVPQLLTHIKEYTKGTRIGWLSGDVLTNRKEPVYIKKIYSIDMTEMYVKNLNEFKTAFQSLQNQVDIIFFYSNAGIQDWDDTLAKEYIAKTIKVPVVTTLDWMMPYATLGYTKIPEEEGEWAAQTALAILKGAKPSDIPEVKSKKGKLMVNLMLAEKLGIVFKMNLLKNAEIIK
jgi:ABC-type uncharacterized transport system substrate-binding protein